MKPLTSFSGTKLELDVILSFRSLNRGIEMFAEHLQKITDKYEARHRRLSELLEEEVEN